MRVATGTQFVSADRDNIRLAHYLSRSHGWALPGNELAPGLLNCVYYKLSPALGQPAAQDGYQFCLGVWIELFGGVQGVGKSRLVTHGDLSNRALPPGYSVDTL